jgi:hypothetical protein
LRPYIFFRNSICRNKLLMSIIASLRLPRLVTTTDLHHLVTHVQGRTPANRNGSFDTFMGRTSLGMNVQSAYRSFTSFSRDSQIVVKDYRLNAYSLSRASDTTVDSGAIQLAIIANLAP